MVGLHRIEPGKHLGFDFLKTRERSLSRILCERKRIAHARFLEFLDTGYNKTHFAGLKTITHLRLGRKYAHLLDEMSGSGSHQHHLVLRTNDTVDNAYQRDNTNIVVKPAVDDQCLQWSLFVTGGWRHIAHDALENVIDTHAGLGGTLHRIRSVNTDDIFDFFLGRIRVGACQVHLVEYRHDFNAQINGRVAVGYRLRFNTLRGINHQKGTFASRQGTTYFIRKVNVPRSVNQIKLIDLPVFGLVLKTGCLRLDRDTALTL